MTDLMQFRVARAPQRRIPRQQTTVMVGPTDLIDSWLESEKTLGGASDYLEEHGITLRTTRLTVPEEGLSVSLRRLRRLDRALVSAENRLTTTQVVRHVSDLFDRPPSGLINDPDWLELRRRVSEVLVAAVLVPVTPDLRGDLTRLMLVIGLVELLADRAGESELADEITEDREATGADEVYAALRWRTVLLPAALLHRLRALRAAVARCPGFADLYVVRNEWSRYEAAEIAHIENVLPGERKERKHVRTDESEQIMVTDWERVKTSERDSQTTDRFDLHDASSTDIALAAHIEGKIDVSGQYGATHVDTHLGGSLDYSQRQADQRATDQSRETVARAVTKVEERTREVRTTRTLLRIDETNYHSLKAGPNQTVVGVYRWVNKVERVQIFRYPHRFLIEFQVPEPAAWWKWMTAENTRRDLLTKEPAPLTVDGKKEGKQLTAADVTADSYLALGARYSTLGLTPPPAPRVVGLSLKRDSPEDPGTMKDPQDKQPIRFAIDSTMTVPDGYVAVDWTATVHSWHNSLFKNSGASVRLSVGSGDQVPLSVGSDENGGSIDKVINGHVGGITNGLIPVAVMTDAAFGFAIDILVTCVPGAEKLTSWQIANYEKITAAHYALKRQYDEEVNARGVTAGVEITGSSPARHREIVHTELKRLVIEMLTGARFSGRSAMEPASESPLTGPHTSLDKAAEVAPEIQFVEQAFEWENLSYILYPHYWADESAWPTLADIEGTDPEFSRFLRAGSARVVVPARPGFAEQTQMYVETGTLWGGGSVPAPDEDGYLSIVAEIRAQQQPPRDGERGESWEICLPTTLVWLQNDAGLPTNPAPTLDEPPGRSLPPSAAPVL